MWTVKYISFGKQPVAARQQGSARVILTFLNSEFWIFPMNLVALAEDFQNQIFFIAQGDYPEF